MAEMTATGFDPHALRSHAEAFATGRFESAFAGLVSEAVRGRAC
jgi:hypothetical protein